MPASRSPTRPMANAPIKHDELDREGAHPAPPLTRSMTACPSSSRATDTPGGYGPMQTSWISYAERERPRGLPGLDARELTEQRRPEVHRARPRGAAGPLRVGGS